MRSLRLTAILAATLLVFAACGSRAEVPSGLTARDSSGTAEQSAAAAPNQDSASPTSTVPDAAPEPETPESSETTLPEEIPRIEAESRDSGPDGSERPDSEEDAEEDAEEPPREPRGAITAVEPRCLTAPDVVEVTIEGDPFSDIAYAASFSDGHHYDNWGLSQIGPTGEFVWAVTVPADAPEGNVIVAVNGLNPDTGNGVGGDGGFRVAGKEGC